MAVCLEVGVKETLINCLCGMKRKAHGAQEPRHIFKYVEVTSTAQRSDSPAQAINQGFLKGMPSNQNKDSRRLANKKSETPGIPAISI